MDDKKDIWGNLISTDIHGNAEDTNAQGERPKDIQGNAEKDFWGNPIDPNKPA